MKAMSLRLPDEQAEQLEAMARVDGVPVSAAVRDAITDRIEAKRHDKEFQARLKRLMEQEAKTLELLAK